MSAETFYMDAKDNKKLHCYKWLAKKPKAVLQIVHGAVEHAGRYADFASYLNSHGISVYAFDLRGHGKTADDPKVPCFAETEGGWDILLEDIQILTCLMKKQNPGAPVFLLGHSMGSFLAVSYFAKYGMELSGGILSGTGTKSKFLLRVMVGMAKGDIKKHGYSHPFPLLHALTFGILNIKIKNAKTPYDFVCSDRNVIDAYVQDEYCGNTATSEFLCEMGKGIQRMNDWRTYENTPKDLSILFISGEFDPMGGHKLKSMRTIYNRYVKAGLKDVSVIVYKGARHEALNEPGRQRAYGDIVGFIDKRI